MCDCICARLVDLLSAGDFGPVTENDRKNAEVHELEEIAGKPETDVAVNA